jgi:hypothetical protein
LGLLLSAFGLGMVADFPPIGSVLIAQKQLRGWRSSYAKRQLSVASQGQAVQDVETAPLLSCVEEPWCIEAHGSPQTEEEPLPKVKVRSRCEGRQGLTRRFDEERTAFERS